MMAIQLWSIWMHYTEGGTARSMQSGYEPVSKPNRPNLTNFPQGFLLKIMNLKDLEILISIMEGLCNTRLSKWGICLLCNGGFWIS